jgi:transposase
MISNIERSDNFLFFLFQRMAPPLSLAKKQLICDMTTKSGMSISKTALAAECSEQAVKYIRSNLRVFGTPGMPPNRVGRWPSITSPMLEALFDYLLHKPGSYLDEMVDVIRYKFGVDVSTDSLRRLLKKNKWSKKTMQQRAKEQNPDLRDEYRHDISKYHSYQLVYVDESGCDGRTGIRKTGWSPPGITPTERSKFHHGQRYQILPAYSQDGIVLSHIYQGLTDASRFKDFIN